MGLTARNASRSVGVRMGALATQRVDNVFARRVGPGLFAEIGVLSEDTGRIAEESASVTTEPLATTLPDFASASPDFWAIKYVLKSPV